jgi:hypothetical protein
MALDRAEHRLDGPESRARVEPTFEDQPSVLAVAGDDVLPLTRQAVWGIDAEEVTQGGLTKAVEMFVVPEERRLRVQAKARLLTDLPDHRVEQVLARLNTASRHLRPGFRMISMVEDEQTISPLDVDNDSLPQRHLMILVVAWASVAE